MTVNAALLIIMGVLYAGGIYLLLERTLTRVLLGMSMMTYATNILILAMAGPLGRPPIVEDGVAPEDYSDPLPQALVLTSIVISFAVSAFMLAMIYRSWKLGRRDEVQVDTEDVKVAEQPTFDAEDDAEIEEETTEFLDEDEDPNADYEHATALNPATGSLRVQHRADGTVRVQERPDPEAEDGTGDEFADEDERPGSPGSRPAASRPHTGTGGRTQPVEDDQSEKGCRP